MPSPGWAHTARYSRSPSSETSAEPRRLPPLATAVPTAACTGLRAVTLPGPANARSIASRALRWTAAMCSRTSCSMRWSKSRWPAVSLMPLASHAAHRTSTHPVNGYVCCGPSGKRAPMQICRVQPCAEHFLDERRVRLIAPLIQVASPTVYCRSDSELGGVSSEPPKMALIFSLPSW